MARSLRGMLLLEGDLVVLSPLSVGGAGRGEAELPLATSGLGELYVPGTSLAGALRAHLGRADPDAARALFGWEERKTQEGFASFLSVANAVVALPSGQVQELRPSVKIDARRGAAADHCKADREVLPRGSRVPLRVEVELPAHDEALASTLEAAFHLLVAELQRGNVRLGGAQSRGLGVVRLEEKAVISSYDFEIRAGLLDWLRARPRKDSFVWSCQPVLKAPPARHWSVTVDWAPTTPILVRGATGGLDIDQLPLVEAEGGKMYAVIPGASIKGALRAQAERILRTLSGGDDLSAAAAELVEVLFGSKARAGALRVEDVRHSEGVEAKAWREESLGTWGVAEDHVAIDRFTGGALDGALYSLRAPSLGGWGPMVLHLDPARLRTVGAAAQGLLLFVLRDLAQGLIPVGSGTTRGHGQVAVKRIAVSSDSPLEIDGRGQFSGAADLRAPVLALRMALGGGDPHVR